MGKRFVRGVGVVLCACALSLGSGREAGAKTTDQSDLWWIPLESGWGVQFVQQETTIFATLFVYDANGKPTWYVATLSYQGNFLWTGTLYATTGPWFGTVPFDQSTVVPTAVGQMNFAGQFIDQGLLIYTVNGVTVTKTVERQNLVTINFGGQYAGTLSETGVCSVPVNIPATPAAVTIAQSGSSATLTIQTSADTCTFPGTYTQGGHLGELTGSYSCASGDSGTFVIAEMAASFYDFRARTILTSNSGCLIKGYVDGLKQPPPPQ